MKRCKENSTIGWFQIIKTHHCVTGSMRHVHIHAGHQMSEEMLIGIGGGVGFFFWHSKGMMPFIGGRHKGSARQGFEMCVGERTGVQIGDFTTTSARKAQTSLLELLAVANQ